ncbi:uncharacterized protein (TIGR03083 family) [Kitasatospora sp. MAP12-15]|uniref:maleylpyruvate isomerase N-terminal domain-containing protein n=1 Tax=unclassified Kitasatospora TaxID=2633591 RepID=UPI002475DD7F|nr:maleylpyruvate isomerase N-terminal domain-containing protein [Kitasatospora sp. MAP12-44]MDH6110585.1 uncharacterized protein (TIGR03083 family) [Kitasatospora sp. MAP12-44]
MSLLNHERLCEGIAAEAGAFAKALSFVELDRMSPTCPEWTAGQLIVHLHQALGWAAELVETQAPAFRPPAGAVEGAGTGATDWTAAVAELAKDSPGRMDEDGEQVYDWLLDQADRLVAALRAAGPQGPVWTPFGPHLADFWASWAVMETAVHRADAELLAGRDFVLDAALSQDSIDYWLRSLADPATAPFFDPRVANLAGTGQTLLFRVTDPVRDTADSWLITRTPDGPQTVVAPPAGTAADVTVTGPAAQLLLLLKRRAPIDDSEVAVTGEAALLRHWVENALT